jgi:signal transduction histidine kinase
VLLAETMRLYVLLARSHAHLRREQDNRLMNFEAMVSAIAHEIKQPLATIELNGSSAQLILEKTPVDVGEMQAITGETIDAARRINDTLDGFRSLFGRIDQKRDAINLNEVIIDVLKLSRAELNDHRIRAKTRLTIELPAIYGNGSQLHQLVYNLVHNAIEAMSEVTGRDKLLEITTRIGNGGAVAVEVLDNGPGVDPQQLTSIFDAFVTTKPHGMGLGLAICRRIVERHGGEISASPVSPHGTNFRILLSPGHLVVG